MDIVQAYFAEHLERAAEFSQVTRLTSLTTRYVLFSVGQLRFALASTDVAAVTYTPEAGCEYLSAVVVVPTRYQASALIDQAPLHYIHLTGTRFGLGPCTVEDAIVLPLEQIRRRPHITALPWIVAAIDQPPSLVLDRTRLVVRLHEIAMG